MNKFRMWLLILIDQLFTIFGIVLFGAAAAGCVTKTVTVEVPKYVFVEVPKSLILPVEHTPPPERQLYLEMSCPYREKALVDIINKQTLSIGQANLQFRGITTWEAEQKAVIEKKEVP